MCLSEVCKFCNVYFAQVHYQWLILDRGNQCLHSGILLEPKAPTMFAYLHGSWLSKTNSSLEFWIIIFWFGVMGLGVLDFLFWQGVKGFG
mgnify:CR=1 FL=1